MYSLDLFGEVIVTHEDIELFIRTVPRHTDDMRSNAIDDYIINYDVVSKIKCMKTNNSFYQLDDIRTYDKNNLSIYIKRFFKAKFKPCAFVPRSMIRHTTPA